MQVNHERKTHDRVLERVIISLFLGDQKIGGEPDYTHAFPDCVVSNNRLCIEETSVRGYDVVKTLSKNANQKELLLKLDKSKIVNRIIEAINKKQKHASYGNLLSEYERRILLVRIDGNGLDWKCDPKIIFNTDNFVNIQQGIFNEIYLVVYPQYPTQAEIVEKVFERPLRSDFVQIL